MLTAVANGVRSGSSPGFCSTWEFSCNGCLYAAGTISQAFFLRGEGTWLFKRKVRNKFKLRGLWETLPEEACAQVTPVCGESFISLSVQTPSRARPLGPVFALEEEAQ